MIASFLDSWSLFQHAYLAGWFIGLLLSMVGVLVVARDQIFIGVAVSQASTLGIALGLGMGSLMGVEHESWMHSESFLSLMAVVGAVLAALLTARGATGGKESPEAITGWVYLMSASCSILLVAHSPFGLEEIYRLLASSIIGATPADVWTFGSFTLLTLITLSMAYRRVLLFALDPAMATAVGMRISLWAGGTAVWLGLAVGLSMRISGVLYTFGNLVLPALIAKNLCSEVATVFLIAPCVAIGTGIMGFILANYYDYPPAQMTVALLSILLLVVWGIQALRRR
jgi:ABC-type Mn2+/Zn2+ transport system permease subunit